MKNFLVYAILAVVGIALSVGSGFNEGSVIGAWVGVVYSVVAGAFVALVDNQMFSLDWKTIGYHVASLIGGSILGAIGYSIF